MNSCLADLSRLIPPHYQRKGRGRIEKTEIIEMAIRHLKHLQNECMQKNNEYHLGYTDCMKEAAKFLYESQMQDYCYRLLARLQEHCDELIKNDCNKSRGCHLPDNVSASSGSPHQPFHAAPPICQLRDMLGTSDIEHSNDHDEFKVKDLSFRNHLNQLQRGNPNGTADNLHSSNSSNSHAATNSTSSSAVTSNNNAASSTTLNNSSNTNCHPTQSQQPHQAAVITSTAPASILHHTDSSNHDFESSREPMLHTDTSNMHSPPPRDSILHQHHPHISHHTSDSLLSIRMRNFSESSHDIEHNNNYKYKNHIKERFNHELHDEETSSEHCAVPPLLQSEHSHTHSMSEHSKDGTEPEIAPIIAKKRKLAEAADAAAVSGSAAVNSAMDDSEERSLPSTRTPTTTTNFLGCDEKPFNFSEIKTELSNSNSAVGHSLLQTKAHLGTPSSTTALLPPTHARSFAVPIFAMHGQGTYYVPLNVDYNVLVPFLNGIDLLEKNYSSMPVVHPININVNFMPPTSLLAAATAAAVAAGKQQQVAVNGTTSKTKVEALTNGW
ncbi:transcription factor cwo [Teleopsis dalmanni]|uniref:transcription factor cwo n=1 Tax=Teleopsis dalmanni TaxID=139649 RepID=UPI0018CFD595|nr:transcription factor cwo [Teleopsis dalmanni]